MVRVLTERELNRATLARQMLLTRENIPIIDSIERLGGLQSQIPNPPYIGLWTRLEGFQRNDLTQLMVDRQIVRAAYLRSTLHLITAADHHRFRAVIQPALTRGLNAFFGQKVKGLDVNRLVQAIRLFLEETPRTMGEIRTFLTEIEPERDGDALAYAVRTYLPLVQVPPGGTWGSGTLAAYTTADRWLLRFQSPADLRALLHRYLLAFGPASLMDFQTWTGITNLKSVLVPMTKELVKYRDEQGRELFDLSEMPLLDADTPAPVRFIPEYDNLLLAHADRTRVIADDDRPQVFLSAGRVLGTVLVDGFVRGTWKLSKTRQSAELSITLLGAMAASVQDELMAEGENLLRFVEPDMADCKISMGR
jgi:Winged helix DNA-binding domain